MILFLTKQIYKIGVVEKTADYMFNDLTPSHKMIFPNCKTMRRQGSISSTYLQAAFMLVAPQSVRTQSSCQYLFTLLESTRAKAVIKKLIKLSPGHICIPGGDLLEISSIFQYPSHISWIFEIVALHVKSL